ncbi:hypothetical protein CPB84DRAFT_1849802 [Gymnopilus junonius]|uniref:Uncharacterized protein n=1 Tax=Gymnopilus junonius TaxID=109634 RepID=A0A9P5NJP3_GYMJU|nr:hypothetical protein CPB84DRAFT_1849802 [Gymnopilus junonius]
MLPAPPMADALQVVHVSSLAAALAKLNINISIEDLLKRPNVVLHFALQPTEATAGLKFTTISKFIPKPTKPTNVDPLAKEHRHHLLELTKQSFPDGKDVTANKLPFILASRIVMTSTTDMSEDPPRSVFENVWCLWDTGVQTSFIVTSQLDATVRDNQTEGNAIMDINFLNVNQTIGSVIHFRPQLPNNVTFIILDQHVSRRSISHSI